MKPVIFCDYVGTIDSKEQCPLLDTLRGFKDEGARIFLATDGDQDEGRYYLEILAKRGYNFFDGIISNERFGYKGSNGYWPNTLRHLRVNADKIIMLDDNPNVLENASRNNIRTVDSKLQLSMGSFAAQVPAVVEKLKAAYQEVYALG